MKFLEQDGKRVAALCKEQGIKEAKLGELTNLPTEFIHRIIAGIAYYPREENIYSIATALNTDVETLTAGRVSFDDDEKRRLQKHEDARWFNNKGEHRMAKSEKVTLSCPSCEEPLEDDCCPQCGSDDGPEPELD